MAKQYKYLQTYLLS